MGRYNKAASHAGNDILVKWHSSTGEFVIIGNARKVSNKVLKALVAGESAPGWEPVTEF